MNPYVLNPWRAFLGLSTSWKLAAAAGLALLLIFATNGAGRAVEAYRSRKFDRAAAEKQREIDALTKERDAHLREAEAREAQAEIVTREAAELRKLLEKSGGRLAAEEEKITDAFERFKTDSTVTSGDVPDHVRRERLCAKLRAAGFGCG
jgi:uncharacterized membrane protein YhiD involved in acid resistance